RGLTAGRHGELNRNGIADTSNAPSAAAGCGPIMPVRGQPTTTETAMTRMRVMTAALGLVLTASAAATDFPQRPITLIVPVAAGGTMDIAGRAFARDLKEVLGQPVVVENKAGGSGNIANAYVARAKPDGYTILFSYEGFHTRNPALSKDLQWDPVKSFTPIGEVTRGPHVILVPKDSPARTLQELIEQAKKAPGRLNFASSGNGSIQHLGAEQFKLLTGTDIMH